MDTEPTKETEKEMVIEVEKKNIHEEWVTNSIKIFRKLRENKD